MYAVGKDDKWIPLGRLCLFYSFLGSTISGIWFLTVLDKRSMNSPKHSFPLHVTTSFDSYIWYIISGGFCNYNAVIKVFQRSSMVPPAKHTTLPIAQKFQCSVERNSAQQRENRVKFYNLYTEVLVKMNNSKSDTVNLKVFPVFNY
jgi:hypothetical protein